MRIVITKISIIIKIVLIIMNLIIASIANVVTIKINIITAIVIINIESATLENRIATETLATAVIVLAIPLMMDTIMTL